MQHRPHPFELPPFLVAGVEQEEAVDRFQAGFPHRGVHRAGDLQLAEGRGDPRQAGDADVVRLRRIRGEPRLLFGLGSIAQVGKVQRPFVEEIAQDFLGIDASAFPVALLEGDQGVGAGVVAERREVVRAVEEERVRRDLEEPGVGGLAGRTRTSNCDMLQR